MIHTHQTAPTQFVEANGIRFGYRRFGKTGGVPIVFNQHYIGTMDYWDPMVTDGLARDREVILFNNAGVSSSSGEVPTTFEQMGGNAIAFIKALGLKQVDILGFSIGGMVAQEITLQAPDLVRRLIVDGTGPRGGQGMELIAQATRRLFGAHPHDPPEVSGSRSNSVRPRRARRRDGVPEAHASSAGWPRSRSERQGVARPGRSDSASGASSKRGPTTI
jgi:Predicted hydrolases or acyltransferases (alpha/beta hydrolase superfamily)